ncbi:DNA polymerase-4 [Halospina denitrificans]|uniref:DNA polymerase IV n=1 Tax=Halospina denitrificans TaxID=332522 RepID=A0A4R7JP06_9GAMM|nr:DNA polymerase IV [Halospina denitrificans]TDT38469.1 DNA polymerase-4 [Halospina denitrificans]
MVRKIIHCDADCFYAAVEIRDNPQLAGLPIAIGGTSGRGVVATCSYEARAFGVRSAMPVSEALRLCPHLELLSTDMPRYQAVSKQLMNILREFTHLVEPLSLDEAYLDVSGSEHYQGSATLMARAIRERVRQELGITVSAGVAPNKFLAKVASDWNKPDGLCVVAPEDVADFVTDLPVEKLVGVGPRTAERLHELGIQTCEQLREWSEMALRERFGRHGARLFSMARGEDDRPVAISRPRKSISVETTYNRNLETLAQCQSALEGLVADLHRRMGRKGIDGTGATAMEKLFVKLRFADFETHTRESLWRQPQLPGTGDFLPLLETLYGDVPRPVRLLGLGVRFPVASGRGAGYQLSLF